MTELKTSEAISVSDIVQLFERGELNFSPVYQRDANVWGPEKKKLCLFSLLNHKYVIPQIIVNARPPQQAFGSEVLDVVDGKQRLTTIIEFVTGKQFKDGVWVKASPTSRLKLGTDIIYHDQLMADSPELKPYLGLSFDKLPEVLKRFVLDTKLDFVKFYEYKHRTIVNMFALLQGGMPLSMGEHLRALDTPTTSRSAAIEEDFKVAFNRISSGKRAAHGQTIMQMLSLGIDPNVQTTIGKMRQLFIRTKDTKKVSASVMRVRDFLAYIADIVSLYPPNEGIGTIYRRGNLSLFFLAWLENDGFQIEPHEFKERIADILNSQSFRLLGAGTSLATRSNRVVRVKHLLKQLNAGLVPA